MTLPKLINNTIGGGVLLISLSIASQAQASSFIYNGHEYSLTTSDTWTGAQSQAVTAGGNLVTINDAAEQSWLISTFGSLGPLWIGLNDAATEGTYQWVSGEPVTYTNWDSGEPNSGFGNYEEDYVSMNWSAPGNWNDLPDAGPGFAPTQGIVEKAVPEPLTMLGAGAALGFGGFFKRKLAKDKKSNKA